MVGDKKIFDREIMGLIDELKTKVLIENNTSFMEAFLKQRTML